MSLNIELLNRRAAAVPRGVATALPVFVARAENAEVWDAGKIDVQEVQRLADLIEVEPVDRPEPTTTPAMLVRKAPSRRR